VANLPCIICHVAKFKIFFPQKKIKTTIYKPLNPKTLNLKP